MESLRGVNNSFDNDFSSFLFSFKLEKRKLDQTNAAHTSSENNGRHDWNKEK